VLQTPGLRLGVLILSSLARALGGRVAHVPPFGTWVLVSPALFPNSHIPKQEPGRLYQEFTSHLSAEVGLPVTWFPVLDFTGNRVNQASGGDPSSRNSSPRGQHPGQAPMRCTNRLAGCGMERPPLVLTLASGLQPRLL
jgi:hypothetical protein